MWSPPVAFNVHVKKKACTSQIHDGKGTINILLEAWKRGSCRVYLFLQRRATHGESPESSQHLLGYTGEDVVCRSFVVSPANWLPDIEWDCGWDCDCDCGWDWDGFLMMAPSTLNKSIMLFHPHRRREHNSRNCSEASMPVDWDVVQRCMYMHKNVCMYRNEYILCVSYVRPLYVHLGVRVKIFNMYFICINICIT